MTIIPTPRVRFDAYLLKQIEEFESELVSSAELIPRANTKSQRFLDMFLDNIDQAISLLERSVAAAEKCESPEISFQDRALLDTTLMDLEAKLDEQLSFPQRSKMLHQPQTTDEELEKLELCFLTPDGAKKAHETLEPLLKGVKDRREGLLSKIQTLKTAN